MDQGEPIKKNKCNLFDINSNIKDVKINLALSGGGFRSTFYCLGAVRRLLELGLWDNVSRIDSVSGGSILLGVILKALKKSKGNFKDISDFDKRVTIPLKKFGQSGFREKVLFCSLKKISLILLGLVFILMPVFYFYLKSIEHLFRFTSLISIVVLITIGIIAFLFCSFVTGLFYLLLCVFYNKLLLRNVLSGSLIWLLDKELFKGENLDTLPKKPEFCINATCINSGKRFRFKPDGFKSFKLNNDKIFYYKDNPKINKLAFAVACSAAFPAIFAPIELDMTPYKKLKENKTIPSKIYLSDGGVYDNLGSESILHKISGIKESQNNEFSIVLDASSNITEWTIEEKIDWFKETGRIIDITYDQVVSLRRRLIYKKKTEAKVAILRLDTPVSRFSPKNREFFSTEIDHLVADIRTDLDTFHDIEIEMLMWAGAIRIDIALKRFFGNKLEIPLSKPEFPEEEIINTLKKSNKSRILLGIWFFNCKYNKK